MTPPSLAACVVVTDEVHDLHACLASLQQLHPLVSQICVYGAGAPERVLEFARQAGAVVGAGPGEGDISLARNEAAALAGTSWVFIVEPHERVSADPGRLRRLLAIGPGMLAQPDCLSIQVRPAGADEGAPVARQARIYRAGAARYDGAAEPQLVPVSPGRKLTILTPAREVVAVTATGAQADPVAERARMRRRIERASATIAALEAGGAGGDDLVTALVDRARLYARIDEDNLALADLTRARATRCTQRYRWRAREDLALLLIRHGHFAGAETVLGELERDGADAGYASWLRALSAAAQGQARAALETLRELGEVRASGGELVGAPAILNERMVMAARVGEFGEALDCCVRLVAVHGLSRRYGRMLLKLWGPRSPQGLADRLVEAGGPHQVAVADTLRMLPEPGPAVAESLLDPVRERKPLAVRVM